MKDLKDGCNFCKKYVLYNEDNNINKWKNDNFKRTKRL